MLIHKKVIPVIDAGVATMIILFIPHDPQSIISSLNLSILVSKILVIIQTLM